MKRCSIRIALLFACAACAFASGCKSSTAAPSPGATPLPCDVGDVVAARCQGCHAAQPKFGAPMPLVSWEDVHAPAKSDPAREVRELIAQRVHDPVRSMPPGAPLPASELAMLDAWLDAGAVAGSSSACEGGADGGTGEPVGPDALTCTVTDTFVAHASGDVEAPYGLAPSPSNQILCFVFKAPWMETTQATGFAPIIDDSRVLHHWILFGLSSTPPVPVGEVFDCERRMPAGVSFIAGWAPGGTNRELPADVGAELPSGPSAYLLLQVHYWNVPGYADVADRSGVAVCATQDLRPNTAGVSTLGSLDIAIPAHTMGHTVTGTCTPALDAPVHLVAAGPHMHTHGRTIKTEVLRGGSESAIEMLVDVQHWDFNAQALYPSSMLIQPGDMLRTTCVYDNDSDQMIWFGEATEDEMCFDFLLAYPAGALVTGGSSSFRTCID